MKRWQDVRSAWRQNLSNLSRIMHPWRLVDSTRQSSQEVERQLQAELQALETLLKTNGLPVKLGTLDKIGRQLAGVSALIDFWWQSVWDDLEQMAMPPRWTQGVEGLLLPLMYWHEQLSRRRYPSQKAQIAQAFQAVQEALSGILAPGSLRPRCWLAGNRGQASMPEPSSGLPRQLKVETAICRRCSIISAACPCVATRCGRRYTTSIVVLQMGQRQQHGFSGERFRTCLRACYRKSRICLGLGNAIRLSR